MAGNPGRNALFGAVPETCGLQGLGGGRTRARTWDPMIKSPQSSDLHSEVADFRTSQGIKLLRHDSGSERTTKPGSSSTVGGKSAQVAAATTLTALRKRSKPTSADGTQPRSAQLILASSPQPTSLQLTRYPNGPRTRRTSEPGRSTICCSSGSSISMASSVKDGEQAQGPAVPRLRGLVHRHAE